MTDKQIIIDGVDVSGCPHYIHKDGSCSSHDCECIKCVHNECFYKDYKAKEQECEELKKIINEAKNSKLDLKSFLVGEAVQNEYEEQLDQLKAQLLDQEAETLKAGGIISKYKQTLTEIKEIAEICSVTDGSNLLLSRIEQILQKCKEVEEWNKP